MNIDEMQAGRELDTLVAEKVMGVEVEWFKYRPDSIPRLIKKGHGGNEWTAAMSEAAVNNYSTDIAAAWQVVEKTNLLVSPTLMLPSGRQWIAGEFKGVQGIGPCGKRYCFERTVAQADTAPLAICRAALKTVQENSG